MALTDADMTSLGYMVYEQARCVPGEPYRKRGTGLSHWMRGICQITWHLLRHYTTKTPKGYKVTIFDSYPVLIEYASSVTGYDEVRWHITRITAHERVTWELSPDTNPANEDDVMFAVGWARHRWNEDTYGTFEERTAAV